MEKVFIGRVFSYTIHHRGRTRKCSISKKNEIKDEYRPEIWWRKSVIMAMASALAGQGSRNAKQRHSHPNFKYYRTLKSPKVSIDPDWRFPLVRDSRSKHTTYVIRVESSACDFFIILFDWVGANESKQQTQYCNLHLQRKEKEGDMQVIKSSKVRQSTSAKIFI